MQCSWFLPWMLSHMCLQSRIVQKRLQAKFTNICFSLVCVSICSLKFLLLRSNLEHCSHGYWERFSPVCCTMWTFCHLLLVNDLGHCWHLKIVSECVAFICEFKLEFCLKNLRQYLQGTGFSPICILIWVFKLLFTEKHFKHTLQE